MHHTLIGGAEEDEVEGEEEAVHAAAAPRRLHGESRNPATLYDYFCTVFSVCFNTAMRLSEVGRVDVVFSSPRPPPPQQSTIRRV